MSTKTVEAEIQALEDRLIEAVAAHRPGAGPKFTRQRIVSGTVS